MNIDPRMIAKLITEDPDHFNEVYARHLLNEIVDPGNTDLGDIEVEEFEDGDERRKTIYNFDDERHDMSYEVRFKSSLAQSDYMGKRFEEHIPVGARVVTIDLESDSGGYGKTKIGNFAFVYSRLTTCVVDYFHNKGNDPMFVQFKGRSTDMDGVYLKIMDRLSKKYPDRGYYPFKFGRFISKSAVSNFEDDTVKMQVLDAIKNQSKKLNTGIANYKNKKRRKAEMLKSGVAPPRHEQRNEQRNEDRFTPEELAYSGFNHPRTGQPMTYYEVENDIHFNPVTGAELDTDEDYEAARQWYQQNRPPQSLPFQFDSDI